MSTISGVLGDPSRGRVEDLAASSRAPDDPDVAVRGVVDNQVPEALRYQRKPSIVDMPCRQGMHAVMLVRQYCF